jgi:phage shock protein A
MWKNIKNLFKNKQEHLNTNSEKLLTLEREIQNLRLELTERVQLIDKLKQQLEHQRTSENNNIQ